MSLEQQRPMVLITGSSGLIGSRLAAALKETCDVVGFDRDPPGDEGPGYDWIQCDLTDEASVASAVEQMAQRHGRQVASVVHLAAYYDFSGQPSPLYQELTVEGTRRLLNQLKSLEVEQFVFSSSLLVMKSAEDDRPLTASSLTDAEWDYPRSKLQAEQVIREHAGDIPVVVLRIAGVYDEMCHSLPIAQQIRRIYEKQLESYFFPGDKSSGQAFIHLHDLIECFRHTIRRRKELAPYEVLLIGEEDVMSYQDLQETLGELIHGKQWPTIRIPKVLAKAGAWAKEALAGDEGVFIRPWMIDLADQNYPVNLHRSRERLGWEPQHRLRQTLPEMVRNLQSDPRHWYQQNKLPLPDPSSGDAQRAEDQPASEVKRR